MIESETDAKRYVRERFGSQTYQKLEIFVEALSCENDHQNLVAAQSLGEVWRRHIVDSLQLLAFVPDRFAMPWLDLGTGSGFPGLVIAAARPEQPVVLVESRRRRCEWLSAMIERLDLCACKLEPKMLDKVAPFDAAAISARAFAPLPRLLEGAARFSTAETLWLLPKGRSARQERDALPSRARGMFHVEQSITSEDGFILIGKGKPDC